MQPECKQPYTSGELEQTRFTFGYCWYTSTVYSDKFSKCCSWSTTHSINPEAKDQKCSLNAICGQCRTQLNHRALRASAKAQLLQCANNILPHDRVSMFGDKTCMECPDEGRALHVTRLLGRAKKGPKALPLYL